MRRKQIRKVVKETLDKWFEELNRKADLIVKGRELIKRVLG
ncbi:hypothetical protein LCGC14_1084220 [marine sediment metagenome]|uniref:Uncharacterized protein n=1 Tax=marine sediment metagenome TaxID=412755 RepID=A0A0F9QKA1_9ZZZZ